MQMLQSDWLSDCTLSAIGVQWLEVIHEIVTFFIFPTFWGQMVNQISEKTKRGTVS